MEYNIDNKLLGEFSKEFDNYLIWGNLPEDKRTDKEKYEDDCKFAFVFIKEKDKYSSMVFVNDKDMKAYEKESYETILLDKPIEYFKFDRWARPMDM